MIQTMNKSIKHILRNYFTNIVFKTTDIFDHLSIRYLSQNTILQKSKDIYTFIYRKIYIYRTSVFHTKKIKIKNKDLKSPGINIDIKRSSKLKQLLYEKFYKKFK